MPEQNENIDLSNFVYIEEACQLLKIKKVTFQSYVSTGKIPPHAYIETITGRKLFDKRILLGLDS